MLLADPLKTSILPGSLVHRRGSSPITESSSSGLVAGKFTLESVEYKSPLWLAPPKIPFGPIPTILLQDNGQATSSGKSSNTDTPVLALTITNFLSGMRVGGLSGARGRSKIPRPFPTRPGRALKSFLAELSTGRFRKVRVRQTREFGRYREPTEPPLSNTFPETRARAFYLTAEPNL